MKHLIHDAAWAATLNIMEKIEDVFRHEEKNDARGLIYEAISAAIEAALAARDREMSRLNSSKN
jgi:hypothetical protein